MDELVLGSSQLQLLPGDKDFQRLLMKKFEERGEQLEILGCVSHVFPARQSPQFCLPKC